MRTTVFKVLTLGRWPASEPSALIMCPLCELTGGPFAEAEAEHLADVHNQLHHGGTRHAEAALN